MLNLLMYQVTSKLRNVNVTLNFIHRLGYVFQYDAQNSHDDKHRHCRMFLVLGPDIAAYIYKQLVLFLCFLIYSL